MSRVNSTTKSSRKKSARFSRPPTATREATLFWHLDERYLGSTTKFRQQALDIMPGPHVVTRSRR